MGKNKADCAGTIDEGIWKCYNEFIMNRAAVLVVLLLCIVLSVGTFVACVDGGTGGGGGKTCTNHVDNDGDGICDTKGCGKTVTKKPEDEIPTGPDRTKTLFENLAYGTLPEQTLDIRLPFSMDTDANTRFRVVVMLPGGTLSGENRLKGFDELVNKLIEAQCATITVNYRDIDKPGITYKEMLSDVNQAVTYLKSVGADYQLNITQLALVGKSTGGYLALQYAYQYATTAPIPVKMVVAQSPFVDFTSLAFYNTESGDTQANIDARLQFASKIVGKTITQEMVESEQIPAEARAASPHYSDTKNVPTLIAHGAKDKLSPYGSVTEFVNKKASSRKVIPFLESGHELDYENDSETLDAFIAEVEAFAKKHFAA